MGMDTRMFLSYLRYVWSLHPGLTLGHKTDMSVLVIFILFGGGDTLQLDRCGISLFFLFF